MTDGSIECGDDEFLLHPAVLVTISDQYTRLKISGQDQDPMLGIGLLSGSHVTERSQFEIRSAVVVPGSNPEQIMAAWNNCKFFLLTKWIECVCFLVLTFLPTHISPSSPDIL